MFRYFYRIYDKYNKEIIAVALFTDASSKSTDTFEYVYFGTRLTYTYNKYVLNHFDEEQLKASPKLFSKALLAAYYFNHTKRDPIKRFAYKEALLKEVSLLKNCSDIEISALFYFVDYLLALPEDLSKELNEEIVTFIQKEEFRMVELRREDMSPTFAAIVESLEKRGMERGIKQGIEKGIEQGRLSTTEEFVRKSLLNHLDVEVIANITGLTVEHIMNLKAKYNL